METMALDLYAPALPFCAPGRCPVRFRATVTRSLIICSLLVQACRGQQKQTSEAFGRYVAKAEARIALARGNRDSFLAMDALAPAQQAQVMGRLREGEVVIEKQGATPSQITGGLIHDWVGTVLIPKATLAQVLALLQDYDHSTSHYAPDVARSRLVSRHGDDFQVFLRLKKHKVITVVLDT